MPDSVVYLGSYLTMTVGWKQFQFVWGCLLSEFGQIWALEVLYNNVLRLIWSLSHATHISAVHLQLNADLESVHIHAVDM